MIDLASKAVKINFSSQFVLICDGNFSLQFPRFGCNNPQKHCSKFLDKSINNLTNFTTLKRHFFNLNEKRRKYLFYFNLIEKKQLSLDFFKRREKKSQKKLQLLLIFPQSIIKKLVAWKSYQTNDRLIN